MAIRVLPPSASVTAPRTVQFSGTSLNQISCPPCTEGPGDTEQINSFQDTGFTTGIWTNDEIQVLCRFELDVSQNTQVIEFGPAQAALELITA